MIRLSFMSSSTPTLTLAAMLDLAKQVGADGIEPRVEWKHNHGVELSADSETRRELRRQAEQAGIAICAVATGCKYADPASAGEQVELTRQYIDLAADIGCGRLRVFGGALPQGIGRDEAIAGVAAALLQCADHAAARSVMLCMETHDDWCDPRHVAQVMQRVDHPAVGVTWDIMHTQRRGNASMDQAHDLLGKWIHHAHVHDGREIEGKMRIVPIGSGEIDHRRAIQRLNEGGYDGYLSGEWIQGSTPLDFHRDHLPGEMATLRRYVEEAGRH